MTNEEVTEFLLIPTEEKLNSLSNKGKALRLLKKLPDSAERLHFLYERGEDVSPTKLVNLLYNDGDKEELIRSITDDIIDEVNILDELNSDDSTIKYQLKLYKMELERISFKAAEFGDIKLLTHILEKDICKIDLNKLAVNATRFVRTKMVNFLIEQGATNKEELKAIVERNRKILNSIVGYKCNNEQDKLAFTVAKSGNEKVLEFMIEQGASDPERLRRLSKENRELLDHIKELE